MRGNQRRALLGIAALLLLLVAVAVASTGSVPAGGGGTRRPAARFVDVALSLYLVLMVFGVGVWIYLLAIRKDVVAESSLARKGRPRWPTIVAMALGFGLLALFVRWLSVDENLLQQLRNRVAGAGITKTGPKGTTGPPAYDPHFATGPVLVVVALIALAALAWYLQHRARRSRLPGLEPDLLPTLADVLGETLDDLRGERDPRTAVIAAYARMERALAAHGLPRHPSEAPDEYLTRIFTDLEVSRRATTRLTALYTWAKFSGHDVAPEMKEEAIDALVSVRDELHALEILEEQRLLEARIELRERAG